MSKKQQNIVIIGGGLAGLTLALTLSKYDFDVTCIDREDPKTQNQNNYDGRTTAISAGSRRVLEAIGIWDTLDPHACAIEQIRVADGSSLRFLHFDSLDTGLGDFGWIIENWRIRRALSDAVTAAKNITYLTKTKVDHFERPDINHVELTLNTGKTIKAALVLGADGGMSATRSWLGIPTRSWSYDQTAIVCNVGHELDHENIAVEHFMPAGPFAILPMTDMDDGTHRSSLVWTVDGADAANELKNLSDNEFNTALQNAFGNQLGKVWCVTPPQSFPLGLTHAKTYIAPRVALIAEAAHRIHPIAGQGLNLSMRDIACLAEVLNTARSRGQDFGSLQVLREYQSWRRGDNLAMAVMTDGLNRLFSNDVAPVRGLRQFGLGVINRIPPAKRFFEKQAMGLSGKLPHIIRTGTL